jgi:metal-responsive CopG/Arc/MetJ family transcriptional regulator
MDKLVEAIAQVATAECAKRSSGHKRFTVVFSDALFNKMDARAEYEDCSLTELMRHAIIAYLKANREHLDYG